MASTNTNFEYSVELSYIKGKETIVILPEYINLLVVSYDYETSFSPIAMLDLNIELSMYNKLVNNMGNAKLLLIVKKFVKGSSNKKVYIKRQLNYFVSGASPDMELDSSKENSDENSYRQVQIGLADNNLMNRERKVIANTIFSNSNLESMVNSYMDFKLVKEPFDNNPYYDIFIVPPISGVYNYLTYMNERSTFYKTGFRYFNDYNYGYLLSGKGKGIDIGDNNYATVKIAVKSQMNDQDTANIQGMIVDSSQKIYQIVVNSSSFDVNNNMVDDNIYNQIYGVTSSGKKKKVDVDINHVKESQTKPLFIRVPNENLNYIGALAKQLENTKTIVNITKTDIDTSVILPCKEYRIDGGKNYKEYTGKYLLSRKIDTFSKDGTIYKCAVSMSFKVVSS